MRASAAPRPREVRTKAKECPSGTNKGADLRIQDLSSLVVAQAKLFGQLISRAKERQKPWMALNAAANEARSPVTHAQLSTKDRVWSSLKRMFWNMLQLTAV